MCLSVCLSVCLFVSHCKYGICRQLHMLLYMKFQLPKSQMSSKLAVRVEA